MEHLVELDFQPGHEHEEHDTQRGEIIDFFMQQLRIADKDAPDIDELFKQKYQGSRYSFGYPACPNLEDQVQLLDLLKAQRIGVSLSDEFQLVPEQSTSALICHHPAARYFNVTVQY